MKKIKIIDRSIENLNHFRCKNCNKWWSIGDAPKEKEEWWCPWCGKRECYEVVENG
jgi:DNA-directed RNA polymerase subunit RPC12/RpoP